MSRDPLYLRGIVLVMVAGCFWSLGGILVRSLDSAGEWQILFYRSCAAAATFLAVLGWRHRGQTPTRFRAAGLSGLVGGLCLACGFTGWIFSLTHTTVANAVFILSATPFATALLARLVLGESVRRATWVTMTVALAGIAVMVAGGVGRGAWFGNATALCAMLGFAGYATALRFGRATDMLPAACFAAIFSAVAAGFMAGDLVVSLHDLAICIVMGVVQIGVGLVLFTVGSRHVPAAELGLLSLTEVVLSPVWVWIGMNEVPASTTLIGGVIVLGAIVGRALTGVRRKPPPFGSV